MEGIENQVAAEIDPLKCPPLSNTVRDGDHVILIFNDGRHIFAHAVLDQKKCTVPLKILKRSYRTNMLVGCQYGTVLELNRDRNQLEVLKEGTPLIPKVEDEELLNMLGKQFDTISSKGGKMEKDNRHLVDSSENQSMTSDDIQCLRDQGHQGESMIKRLIANSTTFENKTEFSKMKYIKRKQLKYQLRCRIVRCTGASVCEAFFMRDQMRIMSLREDALAQILSYANVSAGSQVLCFDSCLGIVIGSLAQRLGGYGKILALYTGVSIYEYVDFDSITLFIVLLFSGQQSHSYQDVLDRFNLSYGEQAAISWIHSGELFGVKDPNVDLLIEDEEKTEREGLVWPCPLQHHTITYVKAMKNDEERKKFFEKRSARFARKLTRETTTEARQNLKRLSDSLVIVSKYDPLPTLMKMLPYLASACPFVVFCEHMEPLVECLHALKRDDIAINMRLSDTWMREYQILPNRTHPNMSMSQAGGFILTGTKLDPVQGKNEIDEEKLKVLRSQVMRSRRGKKKKVDGANERNSRKRKKVNI